MNISINDDTVLKVEFTKDEAVRLGLKKVKCDNGAEYVYASNKADERDMLDTLEDFLTQKLENYYFDSDHDAPETERYYLIAAIDKSVGNVIARREEERAASISEILDEILGEICTTFPVVLSANQIGDYSILKNYIADESDTDALYKLNGKYYLLLKHIVDDICSLYTTASEYNITVPDVSHSYVTEHGEYICDGKSLITLFQ